MNEVLYLHGEQLFLLTITEHTEQRTGLLFVVCRQTDKSSVSVGSCTHFL